MHIEKYNTSLVNQQVLQLLVSIHSNHNETISINSVIELQRFVLGLIANRTSSRYRIAFFCPNEGFEGSFGDIPQQLSLLNCEVLWLYGTANAFIHSPNKNKWLIVNGMISQVHGIDAIVTASVMDCLPPDVLHVLHDHLSFAHFDLEEQIANLLLNKKIEHNYNNINEVFQNISVFVAFMPFYDLVLTSSPHVTQLTKQALGFLNYSTASELMPLNSVVDSYAHLTPTKNYKKQIKVAETGYAKLDQAVNLYRDFNAENIIVYAPTPNDISGNKESEIWKNAISSNDFGALLIKELCENFPNYKIVYKPYKNEIKSVVEAIVNCGQQFDNFTLDTCGGNYWLLYAKAKLLISDFSSTAYTYALGLSKPVLFFSPNEHLLPEAILENTYCHHRECIGEVATSISSVKLTVDKILANYNDYLAKAESFSHQNMVNEGNASRSAASEILSLVSAGSDESHKSQNKVSNFSVLEKEL